MIDTSSEQHRHACEIRFVISLPSASKRKAFLDGVEQKRGKAAADRLRDDVETEWMRTHPRAAA